MVEEMNDTPPKSFRPAIDKPKVRKPWIIERRNVKAFCNPLRRWHKVGSYETEKQRDQAFDDVVRKDKQYEFRKGNTDEK